MNHVRKGYLASFLVTLIMASMASATVTSPVTPSVPTTTYMVAAGCAVPDNAKGTSYYVDPVHGSIKNAGTAAAPWDTLQNVMAQKRSLIKGGDVIYLLSGNHGAVSILNMPNSNFVTIKAAPGATPILTSLYIKGGQKLIFQGLKFQALATGPKSWTTLVSVATSYTALPSQNIIFDSNSLSSAEYNIVNSWTQADWLNKAVWYAMSFDGRGGTNCITATNNKIYNIRNGVAMGAPNSLFAYNTIDNNGDDQLDFLANNLVISHNTLTNNHELGDLNHNDLMQGQMGSEDSYSNIVIDSNLLIDQTYPNMPFPGDVQGIDGFQDNWSNLKITNNTVIVHVGNAIEFNSLQNSLIDHNTVLTSDASNAARIQVAAQATEVTSGTTKGKPSVNNIISNNIATNITIFEPDAIVKNNAVAQIFSIIVDGKQIWYSPKWYKSGIYGNNNSLLPTLNQEFAAFDTVKKIYNLNVKANSPLKGLGSNVMLTPASVYTGSISILANARQIGTPKITFLVNGVAAGTVNVTADAHVGQTGTYTVNFTSQTKPEKIDVIFSGFPSATYDKYNAADIFKFDYTVNGSKLLNLQEAVPHKATTGNVAISGNTTTLYTNGSTAEYNLSGL